MNGQDADTGTASDGHLESESSHNATQHDGNRSAASSDGSESTTEKGRIYLDANATTRPFPEVIETVAHHLRLSYANPGSRHAEGRRARRVLEDAREQIAELLDASPSEVIFTSGGTEAGNMAVFGLAAGVPQTIAVTAGEHPATMESVHALSRQGWSVKTLAVDSDGRLIDEQFAGLPWDRLRLASVILAHNETGVVQDLSMLSALCRQQQVPLHVDAVQAVGKLRVRFHELGATALSLAAHKFHGPRGIGALLLQDDVTLAPFQYGGHQEGGRRPGTECVALAAGMARALELCMADFDSREARLKALRDRLEQGLRQHCSPVVVNGSGANRLANTLNISFPGLDGEALLVAFELDGIACSLGSTCASGSAEPAPALVAMGCPSEVYRSAVRFSVSEENRPEEMDAAVQRISRIVQRLRSL